MFSQLFVRPNPTSSTDSYVYVTDEILFVEQDVNLEINTNDADTQASIYLRDEAQLIQGATASNNDGTGFLSVQQVNPVSDAWDYTYWCAPVGNPTLGGGTAGNKNFGILHFYEPDDPMVSKTNATVANFTPLYNGFNDPGLTISRRWIYTHTLPGTEAEGNYQFRGQNYTIPAGYGFTMKGVNNGTTLPNNAGSGDGNHDQDYDFRGRPNNGTFNYTVDGPNPTNPNLNTGLMTLAGNPYPSAIDLAMVITDNPNVGAIWFYDEDRGIDSHYYSQKRYGYTTWINTGGSDINPSFPADGTTGTYAAAVFKEWDASGGNGGGGTGGTGDNTLIRRFAPIGQGFMLIGNGSGTTAHIDNSMRVFRKESEGYSDFRTNEATNPNDTNRSGGWWDDGWTDPGDPDPDPLPDPNRVPELRIVTEFTNSHQREMVLLFHNEATLDYDHGMDGMHPMDATSEIYFPINHNGVESPYVIQTVPFDTNLHIPIDLKVSTFKGKIYMKIVEEINFNGSAYLYDNLYESYAEITGGNEASFDIYEAGEYEERFYIVFESRREAFDNSKGTLLKEETRANVNFFQNNPLKQLEILNPEGYDIKSAMIYDMAGKLVINKTNLGNNSIVTLPTSNLADGIYLVQLTTSENINIDYKMIIKNN